MAQKLLKTKTHKIAPKKIPAEETRKVVLVGTYRGDQLEAWPGYYNYPLSKKDKVDVACAKKVNEIWLFQGAKDGRFFAAEFVGTKDDATKLNPFQKIVDTICLATRLLYP